jgi:hypothetical protein
MFRFRALVVLVASMAIGTAAQAQPVDPYKQPAPIGPAAGPAAPNPGPAAPKPAPSDPAAPQDPYGASPVGSAQDPMLAERVAAALVTRAQELLDTKVFLDAKQLAVEALIQSPKGSSSEHARAIIHAVNRELGIPEDSVKPEPAGPAKPVDDIDSAPIQDPTLATPPVGPPAEGGRRRSGRASATVHGALYGGLIGTTIGAFLTDDSPAKGAVPVGIVGGLAGALVMPRLADKLALTESQVRVVGSATMWGGVVGGLFGDIAKTSGTTAREVLVAATATSTLAGLGGIAYARTHELTRGDVALVDTLAGLGAVGGLTIGMVMQPVETEAYSLNSALGITAGVVIGAVAGPQTNTTPRRMARVASAAAIGGAAPFLVYAVIYDPQSNRDERITGVLSTGGLVVGAILGFHWTRGMDAGLDVPDGKAQRDPADAPVALIGRSSSGRWGLGGIGVQPLAPVLAPQRGMALQLVGATF